MEHIIVPIIGFTVCGVIGYAIHWPMPQSEACRYGFHLGRFVGANRMDHSCVSGERQW